MEKLKEAVIEFNKRELTYDLELHVHDSNIPQMGLHLLTSEKRKHFNTCIKVTIFKDMHIPQDRRYLYATSMSTEEYFQIMGILVITPTSILRILKHQVK